MTSTTITDNFSLTHWNQACLIQMPPNFTSVEADSFKQIFQQFCRRDSILFRGNFFRLRKNSSTIKKIILDFEQTTHIDSSGLAGLCQVVQLAKNIKFDLTFRRFSPQVKIVLSLAGLEQVFVIDDATDAIAKEDSMQQTSIYNTVLSKSNLLLDICSAIVRLLIAVIFCSAIVPLGIMVILLLPFTNIAKFNREFIPNL